MGSFRIFWLLSLLAAGGLAPLRAQSGQRHEEGDDHYRKWLDETVLWIITEEEREVFLDLSSDEERDAFIEQFWLRRDSDPATAHNEFKDEHYRRIAYANEHFSAGIDGWKTDRGRIYIRFGPPDRRETYPAGGQYQRQRKEGGGYTSVFPFERWEYRHIPGVGDNVELEFVDDEGGGLYELTFDRQRKDELLHTGFAAPTWDEEERAILSGIENKQDRVAGRRISGEWRGAYSGMGAFETAADKPFSQLELSGRLEQAPEIRYKDLQAAVSARVSYDRLPFVLQASALRLSPEAGMAVITVQVANRSLGFRHDLEGMARAQLQIFGRVVDLGKRVIGVFEDDLERSYPAGELEKALTRSSVYQHRLALEPGVYKVEVGVKDAYSANIGTQEVRLEVLNSSPQQLALSSLILADRFEELPEDSSPDRFALGDLRVIPRPHGEFRSGESLGLYLQLYNPSLDQSTQQPDLQVEYALTARGSKPQQWRDASRMVRHLPGYSRLARLINLSRLDPGEYQVRVRVRDRISGATAQASESFSIVN